MYVYIYMCIYITVNIYIHICMYIYTYTQICPPFWWSNNFRPEEGSCSAQTNLLEQRSSKEVCEHLFISYPVYVHAYLCVCVCVLALCAWDWGRDQEAVRAFITWKHAHGCAFTHMGV